MRIQPLIAFFAVTCFVCVSQDVCFGKSTSDVFREAKDSVVLLIAYDGTGLPSALGSGFFVETNVVASNYHVVDGASALKVTLLSDGKTYKAKRILGYSKNLDMVLIEIPCEGKPLPISPVGEQQVGEKVVAIGNPRGLTGTVSEGIISAIRKAGDYNYIQITTPISPGSSGGPLLNADGSVIGITTATLRDSQNLNFAVPATLISKLDRTGKAWEPVLRDKLLTRTKGTEGVRFTYLQGTRFSNDLSQMEYSLVNTTDHAIKNIDYMLVFKRPKTGEVVHYLRCLDKVEILPKLAKKQIHRMNDMEGWYHVKENVRPEVKVEVEFRLLSYEIIDTDPNVEK